MERLFWFTIMLLLFGLVMDIASVANVTSGLAGYWPLDGDASDKFGNTEGKLVSGADWVEDGRTNGAVELDGSSGYVEISGFELITDTMTFVAWINGWKQDNWAGIVSLRGGDHDSWMGFTDQDTLSYVWNNDSDQTWGWEKSPKIPQNEWAMAALTILWC